MSPGARPWLGRHLAAFRGRLLLAFGAMGVVALTRALYAALVGPALQLLLDGGEVAWAPRLLQGRERGEALLLLAGCATVAAVAKAVAWYLQRAWMAEVGLGLGAAVRKELHTHLLRVDPRALLEARRGDLATRIASDPRQLSFLVDPGLETLARVGLTVVCVGGFALWLDPTLGAVALGAWPLVGVVMARAARRARRLEGSEADDRGAMAGKVGELAGLVPLVRAWGAEAEAARSFGAQVDAAADRARQSARVHARTGPLVELLAALASALLLALVGRRGVVAPADAGRLVSFFGACFFLYAPLRGLAYALEGASWGLGAADRLRALLALPPEPPEPPGPAVPLPLREAIRLRGLRCELGGVEMLRGVDLELRVGEAVALVGPSGAGKSTLLSVLLRLVDPSAGQVLVDGQDVASLPRRAVRGLYAWVTQDPLLFADSVAANVALGEAVDRARLAEALAGAGAAGFVAALPEGADTLLAEGGAPLSAGQRQRLCVARALYRRAPVLLLDEPTASLDGAAEAELSATLEGLLGARTVVLVTHRLSTLRRCGRVVVLEGGRVVQEGPLAEVWRAGTPFARLFGEPPA